MICNRGLHISLCCIRTVYSARTPLGAPVNEFNLDEVTVSLASEADESDREMEDSVPFPYSVSLQFPNKSYVLRTETVEERNRSE